LSAYLTATNQLRTTRIVSIRNETPTIKSFALHDSLGAKASPGQFVMIWIPGIDEIPMSLSTISSKENLVGITVKKVGEATGKLHNMKIGDVVGIRGPFGNGYTPTKARKVMIVGGGTGLASLAPLTEEIGKQKERKITFLLGAKKHNELLFLERIKAILDRANGTIITSTEDGSYGIKGLITESAEQLLAKEEFDIVYACGPEMMMHKMFQLTEKAAVPFQASLERLMRCAIGLCGTCVIGKYRVCKDGPVFSGVQLREVRDEFGHFKRGFDSRKLPFKP